MMYRIQFATPQVKPTAFPDFPYAPTEIAFDCILFTAVVDCEDVSAALESIRICWKDAEIRYVQPGDSAFEIGDVLVKRKWFGTMQPHKQDPLWKRALKAPVAWAF